MNQSLFKAIRNNDIEALNHLLDNNMLNSNRNKNHCCKKIDINCQEQLTGNTALHIAVIYDNMPVIEKLLDYGADLTIKNNKGLDATLLYHKLYFRK